MQKKMKLIRYRSDPYTIYDTDNDNAVITHFGIRTHRDHSYNEDGKLELGPIVTELTSDYFTGIVPNGITYISE